MCVAAIPRVTTASFAIFTPASEGVKMANLDQSQNTVESVAASGRIEASPTGHSDGVDCNFLSGGQVLLHVSEILQPVAVDARGFAPSGLAFLRRFRL